MNCKHIWEQQNGGEVKCLKCKQKVYEVATLLNDSERYIEKLEKELNKQRKLIDKLAHQPNSKKENDE